MTKSSSQADSSGFDAERVRNLTGAVCDGLIAPAELEELQQVLLANGAAREMFLADVCVHAGLEWDVAARGRLETLIDSCRSAETTGDVRGLTSAGQVTRNAVVGKKLRRLAYWAAAAGIVASATLLSLSPRIREQIVGTRRAEPIVQQGNSAKANETAVVIAKIVPKSDDCHWMFESQSIENAAQSIGRPEVRAGETLRVMSGTLQLTYEHGTAVSLAAPAMLEIATPMQGRLIRGRATVNVAPGAEGFTINTLRTSVVDLGTVFGVEVDEVGGTDVVVFSGAVDVTYSSDVTASVNAAELGKQRLHTGEAMRIDERGTLSRIISLNANHFADARAGGSIASSRKPVISTVHDNIQRDDAWNFYEIVPEGFGEDVKAFVDRLHHEWNGIDKSGMPAYLVGGDYVKSFNDDKNVGTIEVSVQLDEPANLYVLWCKRVPAPGWLREEFEETGDEIGVDEGRHVFRDGTVHNRDGPRTGPGESIDSIHTIWRRVVESPGVIRLGPVEAPGWDFNMYGIVAVPLTKSDR